jgi:hypothetical protein
LQHHGGTFHRQRRGEDLEHVVHMRRLLEIDAHVPHHEGEARRLAGGLLKQCAVIGADQAQVVGAPALHEAQIACVVDQAGKIRVLVIDPNLLVVAAVADSAIEGIHH